jgi:hypothetical protein
VTHPASPTRRRTSGTDRRQADGDRRGERGRRRNRCAVCDFSLAAAGLIVAKQVAVGVVNGATACDGRHGDDRIRDLATAWGQADRVGVEGGGRFDGALPANGARNRVTPAGSDSESRVFGRSGPRHCSPSAFRKATTERLHCPRRWAIPSSVERSIWIAVNETTRIISREGARRCQFA